MNAIIRYINLNHPTKKQGFWLTMLLGFAFVFIFYGSVFFHANDYLFSLHADGLKNYYVYAYHISHDASYMSFEGMHYPYGESILLVDCHPFMANCLKFISQNMVDISDYSIGILNIMMLLSIVLCSAVLYLILLRYNVPVIVSIVGGLGISILSSQVLLWELGHYALSYSVFFPLGWFLLIMHFRNWSSYKFSVLIAINMLFWFYTHNYLGMILLLFTFLSHVVFFLQKYHSLKTGLIRYLNQVVIQIVVPIAFLLLLMNLFDNQKELIDWPFFTTYKASVNNVFMPFHSYLKPVYELFFDLSHKGDHLWSKIGNYIGISANIILLYLIFYSLYLLFRGQRNKLKKLFPSQIACFIIASIIILLYAMAFPFQYAFQDLLKIIPHITQFMGLGRFAWAFYYVITVNAIVVLFLLIKKQGIAKIVAIIAASLMIFEGSAYHQKMRDHITKNRNTFLSEKLNTELNHALNQINKADYQAIIPLPFYHKFITLSAFKPTHKSEVLSMNLSYHTALPLVSAHLSRPSVPESRKIVQMFAPNYYPKSIENDIDSDKPFLIIHSHEALNEQEADVLTKASEIYTGNSFSLYHLKKDSLFHINQEKIKNDFNTELKTMQPDISSGLYAKDTGDILAYSGFENNGDTTLSYRGNYSYHGIKTKLSRIYTSERYVFDTTKQYALSFWYYNHLYDQSFNTMWIEETDTSGNIVNTLYFDPVKRNIGDGNWLFNEISFEVTHPSHRIKLFARGKDYFSNDYYIDELLIRPENKNILGIMVNAQGNKMLVKNNETIIRDTSF